jgi:hypothetical protein
VASKKDSENRTEDPSRTKEAPRGIKDGRMSEGNLCGSKEALTVARRFSELHVKIRLMLNAFSGMALRRNKTSLLNETEPADVTEDPLLIRKTDGSTLLLSM